MAEEKKLVRKSQRSSRLSTVVSISLVLFLLGVLGVLLLHAHKLSNYVKENIEISILLKPEADSLEINELYNRVSTANYILSARVVSIEEAAEGLKRDLGEDFVNFLGYNPLFPSIDVRLKADFADNATIQSFISSVRTNPAVKEVQYQASLVESINRNLRAITWILLAFSGLLIVVSVALINNTIRIALYAKRMLIKSMLLVGATKGFIRKPFLMLSIWNGIIGGLVSLGLLAGLLYFALEKIPELNLIQDYRLMGIVAGSVLIIGIFLSLICTWFAVNKYLRYRTEDLY
ncbi:permease-like cell division protein FtsX [soil metagenome]